MTGLKNLKLGTLDDGGGDDTGNGNGYRSYGKVIMEIAVMMGTVAIARR